MCERLGQKNALEMETYMVDGWMVSLDSLSLNFRIEFLFVRVPTFSLELGWVRWVRGCLKKMNQTQKPRDKPLARCPKAALVAQNLPLTHTR